jgi:hypothetical protein
MCARMITAVLLVKVCMTWWCIPVILATQETEGGRSRSKADPKRKLEILSEKLKQKDLGGVAKVVEQVLKYKAQISNLVLYTQKKVCMWEWGWGEEGIKKPEMYFSRRMSVETVME